MSRTILVLRVLIPLLLLVAAWPADAAMKSPSTVVGGFHDSLLAVMKEADSLGIKGRFQRLEEPISKAFDLSRMIRVASGSFWKKAGRAKRNALLAAFSRMSIGTYAHQFDGHSGEAFKTVGEKPGPQGTILVHTQIVRTDESPVDLTYVLKKVGGAWRIADILLDNTISQLAVRRSEYRLVLRKDGVDGLIATLEHKADELTAE